MQLSEAIPAEMSRPKVLIWHWGRRGGGPRYTLELVRALAERNEFDIFVSLSRQSEIYTTFDDISVSGRFDINTYETRGQFFLRSTGLLSLRRKFRAYLLKNQITIVLCTMDHLWNIFVAGAIAEANALYLLAVHDATRHPGEDQPWRRWLLERDIALSDGALVLTKSVAVNLAVNYNYPRERIYQSTLGQFSYGVRESGRELPSTEPVKLLFFGRILAYKGLDILLQAFSKVREKFPKIELRIVGDGDLLPYRELLNTSSNIKIENRWIEEEEISDIFASADLAVLPYREASQSAVVATAFAAGMPCVATPIPGLCEQVKDGHTGVIAKSMSSGDFADAICRVLLSPSLYQQLSTNCLTAARTELSWKTASASVTEAIHKATKQGSRKK